MQQMQRHTEKMKRLLGISTFSNMIKHENIILPSTSPVFLNTSAKVTNRTRIWTFMWTFLLNVVNPSPFKDTIIPGSAEDSFGKFYSMLKISACCGFIILIFIYFSFYHYGLALSWVSCLCSDP